MRRMTRVGNTIPATSPKMAQPDRPIGISILIAAISSMDGKGGRTGTTVTLWPQPEHGPLCPTYRSSTKV